MRIAGIKIKNFRKLKDVSIDLRDDTTVFIGANNSGKTSAMVAIKQFLTQGNFNIYDFTLPNHAKIREVGVKLENEGQLAPDGSEAVLELEKRDLSLWKDILPSLDLWFDVGDNDIHYVSHILPTLDWVGGNLGIRLLYQPKDVEEFYIAYKEARSHAKELKTKALKKGTNCNADLFPNDLLDFLKRDLKKYFAIRYYVLDPSKKTRNKKHLAIQ